MTNNPIRPLLSASESSGLAIQEKQIVHEWVYLEVYSINKEFNVEISIRSFHLRRRTGGEIAKLADRVEIDLSRWEELALLQQLCMLFPEQRCLLLI